MPINIFEMLLWTFRRNENDVVNLYDSLSPIMQLSTDGDMLNFGYWDDSADKPVEAQKTYVNLPANLQIYLMQNHWLMLVVEC